MKTIVVSIFIVFAALVQVSFAHVNSEYNYEPVEKNFRQLFEIQLADYVLRQGGDWSSERAQRLKEDIICIALRESIENYEKYGSSTVHAQDRAEDSKDLALTQKLFEQFCRE